MVSRRIFDSFLSKTWPDRMRAVHATLRHVLVRAGILSPMGGRQFRRVVAQDTSSLLTLVRSTATIEQRRYIAELLQNPRYDNPKMLTRHGFKVYSQGDEDGFIQEIFNRIGVTSRTFVEFGVGDGLENNTVKLLLEGWSGLWLEGSPKDAASIRSRFRRELKSKQLSFKEVFIDAENINSLIGDVYQGEIDLLSIDIDGNDIHVLKSIDVVNPRALVIEYNGKFPPPISIAPTYTPSYMWSGTDYNGSSLAAITKIAETKNYTLVGCNIIGTNAFFVRTDLVQGKFASPATPETHFEPARYFLLPAYTIGHQADWGIYDRI